MNTEPHSPTAKIAPAEGRAINLRRGWMACFMVCVGVAAISVASAKQQVGSLTRFTYTEYHMGIDARIVVYAPDLGKAERACTAAFARIAELDTIMSDYRRDSELNRLSDAAGGPAVHVSRDLFLVLKRSEEVSRVSDGAFDITAGPLIALWRQARKSGVLPDPSAIRDALQKVGWQRIVLDEKAQTAQLTTPGMRLDLGGIAKGYAADEAQKELKRLGLTRALVEMGGDVVLSGPPPGTKGWTIRVPNAGVGQVPRDILFADSAISTSGDTEQFTIIGGVQYSHIVDPRTGQALTNRVQASIVGPIGLTTDPLATALSVLGREGEQRLLKAYRGATSYVKVLKGVSGSKG